MFNFSRFAKFLANGEMPTETALDEAIAGYNENKKREDSAIEVITTYLEQEDSPIERNQFAKRWGLKKESAGGKKESEVTEDADVDKQDGEKSPTDLEKHDARFHPKGYKEGDACKYRETLAKSDNADDLKAAEKAEGGNLSNKKRDEYNRLMAKKHPELDPAVVLSEIAKIADPKLQHDAFVWTLKGAVKLPEDMYKVEQARELATKAKKDPLSWDSPQACINELTGEGHKISEKRITVDELKKNPLMSDYRDEGYGVETFEVEDSKEGQQLMREVINTHWGKDANPWCLLHGDGEGNLSDGSNGGYDAWHYWQNYSALPKRVAFKDGKLLAFMATDGGDECLFESDFKEDVPELYEEYSSDKDTDGVQFDEWLQKYYPNDWREIFSRWYSKGAPEEWWDRQDKSHDGIPLGNMPVPNDTFGRWAFFEIRDGELKQIGGYIKGEDGKEGFRQWYANGKLAKAVINGDYLEWHENGALSKGFVGDLSVTFLESGELAFVYDNETKNYFNYLEEGKTNILDSPETIQSLKERAERIYRENTQTAQRTILPLSDKEE